MKTGIKFITDYFKREAWSPYVAGAALGLVSILAVLLTNSLLGASGAFENIAGWVGQKVAPAAFDNMYFNFVMPPGLSNGVILLIGVFFGGMLAALSSGTFKFRTNDNAQWNKIMGKSTVKRWLLLFIGAVILEYGAGIAGGCTSGLAISGGMLLAPSAFIFIAGMFISGIVVARIIYREKY